MIGKHLEIYTFDYLMNQALTSVPDTMDKRQGSIIYDALAPACYRLADLFMQLRNVYFDTFIYTAQGQELDYRVAEQGIQRYPATFALKKACFTDSSNNPKSIPLGSRFSTVTDTNPINYQVISPYVEESIVVPGCYVLKCEVSGIVGNEYTGDILNITNIPGIASAVMSDLIEAAVDEETDDELRNRFLDIVSSKPFAGNRIYYIQLLRELSNIGDVQVYPVWDGGGTVKCSIIDSNFEICAPELIQSIQDEIDPGSEGKGIGWAPIGHQVTVTTPTGKVVNVECTITVSSGYQINQLTSPVEDVIEEYFNTLRNTWGIPDDYGNYALTIYTSRIMAAILNVQGVDNVEQIKLNGVASNIILTETGELQELPILGTVIINEQ